MNVSHLPEIFRYPDVAFDRPAVEGVIAVTRDLFGTSAKTVIARCALVARSEGSEEAYRFWLSAFKVLDTEGQMASAGGGIDGSAEADPSSET
jgi:hypothetical protein